MNAIFLVSDPAADLKELHLGSKACYTLDTYAILERQKAQESNARSYPRLIPLVLKKAHGIYVEDSKGQVYIDCLAGAGTLALGHNHPVTIEADSKCSKIRNSITHLKMILYRSFCHTTC